MGIRKKFEAIHKTENKELAIDLYHSLEKEEDINKLLVLACEYGYEELVVILLRDPRCDVTYHNQVALYILLQKCAFFEIFKLILSDPRTDLSIDSCMGVFVTDTMNDEFEYLWLLEILKHPTVDYTSYNYDLITMAFSIENKSCAYYLMETEFFIQHHFPQSVRELMIMGAVEDYETLQKLLRIPISYKIDTDYVLNYALIEQPVDVKCIELLFLNFSFDPVQLKEIIEGWEKKIKEYWKDEYEEDEITRIRELIKKNL